MAESPACKDVRDDRHQCKGLTTDFDTVKTAKGRENKSYDFYESQSQNVTYDAERDFYEALAAGEREHEPILVGYYEHLTDPSRWLDKNLE